MKNAAESRLGKQLYQKKVIIFGNGVRGKSLYSLLFDCDIQVDAYADNNKTKWSSHMVPEVLSPESAVKKYPDDIFYIANMNHSYDIKKQLLELRVSPENIVIWNP